MFDTELIVSKDFLIKEFGFNLDVPPSVFETKCKDYYLNICTYIAQSHYLSPTPDEIETFILEGEVTINGSKTISSPIVRKEDRVYLFVYAQAKQFLYDAASGRGAMLRGEDKKFNICSDALDKIRMLGLCQRTFMTQ